MENQEDKTDPNKDLSSKRVIRLKKSNTTNNSNGHKKIASEYNEIKREHTTEVVESAWNKYIGPRTIRTSVSASILAAIGLIAYFQPTHQWWGILVVFTAALVVAEILELRLIERPPIPISFAVVIALARTYTNNGTFSWQHVSIVVTASLIVSTLCYANISIVSRIKIFFARMIVYAVGITLARIVFDHVPVNSQLIYLSVIAAVAIMLGVHEILAWLDGYKRIYGFFAAAAHLSVIAGGVLIGVGYGGTRIVTQAELIERQQQLDAGQTFKTMAEAAGNGLGISALITCAIPLLVAWFAFSRYYQSLITYKQTIRALSAAPELGGLVSWGHAERVSQLALAVANKLDLDRHNLQNIETAAFMHTLGEAVLDMTPDITTEEEAQAAQTASDIIRTAGGLERVADIIADHVKPYRGVVDGNLVAQNDIAASILRVANDYDNISRREESWGIRALNKMLEAPGATYNPRALEALEWVLRQSRYSDLINPPEIPQEIRYLLDV